MAILKCFVMSSRFLLGFLIEVRLKSAILSSLYKPINPPVHESRLGWTHVQVSFMHSTDGDYSSVNVLSSNFHEELSSRIKKSISHKLTRARNCLLYLSHSLRHLMRRSASCTERPSLQNHQACSAKEVSLCIRAVLSII